MKLVGVNVSQWDKIVNGDPTDALIETILEALSKGEKVTIAGFGTFYIKERKAKRRGQLPSGEVAITPAKRSPSFKPSKELQSAVRMLRK